MATSTEATVRDVIVAAIRAIAVTSLGFDEANGNVKSYPLKSEHPEKRDDYTLAFVGNIRLCRCWSVDVRAIELYVAQRDVGMLTRLYTVSIEAFYEFGVGGDGHITLIDHARNVRESIKNLGTGLSGTVSRMVSLSPLQISPQSLGNEEKLVGEFSYEFERINPDW